MRIACLIAASVAALWGQGTQQSLIITRIYNITPSWAGECAPGTLDNRSPVNRLLNYYSVWATATGSWAVDLQYSDLACTGPYTSFAGAGSITQTSGTRIAAAVGYHPYIHIQLTGSVSVNFSGEKDFYIGATGGGGGGGGGGGVAGDIVFTAGTGQTGFTAPFGLTPSSATMVFLNGDKQIAGTGSDFFITGNTVTFTRPLVGGDLVEIVQIAGTGGGGGGGGGNCPAFGTLSSVPFSSAPTFNLATSFAQTMTLTGTVTSVTFTNIVALCNYQFYICQDGVGQHSFAWPSSAIGGAMSVGLSAGSCSLQQFYAPDGTHLRAIGPGIINMM